MGCVNSAFHRSAMPWWNFWRSSNQDEHSAIETYAKKAQDAVDNAASSVTASDQKPFTSLIKTPWAVYTQPQTVVATLVLTTLLLGSYRFYRTYLRRIAEAGNISPRFFRTRSIFGKVTSVGDGDNFRLYHTPGGLLAGWHWLPFRHIPSDRKELRNKTVRLQNSPRNATETTQIHVRLAGIDAPELAHFGRPSQPYAQQALEWLTDYVNGRRVRAYVYKPDQYSRVVATVYVRKGLLRRDVGLQMLRAGLATVYEAKTGAEFGEGLEQKYRDAEWWAKTRRKGMWSGNRKDLETPREYKTRFGTGLPAEEAPKL